MEDGPKNFDKKDPKHETTSGSPQSNPLLLEDNDRVSKCSSNVMTSCFIFQKSSGSGSNDRKAKGHSSSSSKEVPSGSQVVINDLNLFSNYNVFFRLLIELVRITLIYLNFYPRLRQARVSLSGETQVRRVLRRKSLNRIGSPH